MKLTGSGKTDKRAYYIFEKHKSFFSLFPKFLIGCGFDDIKQYEEYQEKVPDITNFENVVDHFRNQEYDVDVIFTRDRIILIVRTDEKNKENLVAGIQAMTL